MSKNDFFFLIWFAQFFFFLKRKKQLAIGLIDLRIWMFSFFIHWKLIHSEFWSILKTKQNSIFLSKELVVNLKCFLFHNSRIKAQYCKMRFCTTWSSGQCTVLFPTHTLSLSSLIYWIKRGRERERKPICGVRGNGNGCWNVFLRPDERIKCSRFTFC